MLISQEFRYPHCQLPAPSAFQGPLGSGSNGPSLRELDPDVANRQTRSMNQNGERSAGRGQPTVSGSQQASVGSREVGGDAGHLPGGPMTQNPRLAPIVKPIRP